MVRKKIDNRIRVLIENGVALGHRTMFAIVGEKARDQVVFLHHILSKSIYKGRPSVLWCYKKDLGFSSHKQKKTKSLQKKAQAGKIVVNEDDPFELFVLSTKIRYCYYKDTKQILGNTYGMCILQDFEALTPDLLARTIETVEGGGIIVFLLQNVNSLKQLYTMHMDVHKRYRTESHQDVVCRFNERFILSLASCKRSLVIDDQLRVLPISSQNLKIDLVQKGTVSIDREELNALKESLRGTDPVFGLVNCCKTIDQARSLLKMIEAISEKTLSTTVSLTAARGRGKSATLGLAVAGAVAFGYSNIYITSPSPENLKTLFEFVCKGFDALAYLEHTDYSLIRSTKDEFKKSIVRINVTRDHRQTIQYIHPTDYGKLSQAELLVIDEAAAIPLTYVKSMLGPYLTFLSSTINGYEGTGRSLSLKLLQQLRTQTTHAIKNAKKDENMISGRRLEELSLEESIRYSPGDVIEKWLTNLLCLDATTYVPTLSGCPPPEDCDLYYINRDSLFSSHKLSEMFLQKLVALYVSSHYKNSPNDLQMMSDAPAHHLFCLLEPVNPDKKALPEILVVLQVCLEGEINKETVDEQLSKGRRSAGDLIPWLMAEQFNDKNFPSLSGARIVRIATHPDYQGMGYGIRAMTLLKKYYKQEIFDLNNEEVEEKEEPPMEIQSVTDVDILEETIAPRTSLPPLLLKLSQRKPENLNYIGVCFGLTEQLLKFWKKSGFVPTYIKHSSDDITGERSCIMLHNLEEDETNNWLEVYWKSFRRRFISVLTEFKDYSPALALSVLTNKKMALPGTTMSKAELDIHFMPDELERLESYSNNLAYYHNIRDLVPQLARLYFLNKLGDVEVSAAQAGVLLGLGLQRKTVDQLAEDLKLTGPQVISFFNKFLTKAVQHLNMIAENYVSSNMLVRNQINENVEVASQGGKTLHEELEAADKELKVKQKMELEKLKRENLEQYKISGTDEEWQKVLTSGKANKTLISVKSGEKRVSSDNLDEELDLLDKKSKNDKSGRKKKRFSK